MPVWQTDRVEKWSPPGKPPPGGDGPGGDGPGGDGPGGDGPGGDGPGKPPPGGDGPGGDGPGGDGPGGDGPGGNMPSPEEIHREIEKKLSQREDESGQPNKDGESDDDTDSGRKGRSGGSPGREALTGMSQKSDKLANITPKMNWKTLIRKLVSSSIPMTDVSYAKPSRRSVTGAAIGAALGAAAVKPGEKTLEEPVNKLVLVFDTSGSMSHAVTIALKEAENLLKQLGKNKSVFGVTFFAGNHISFAINTGEDYYAPLMNLGDLKKPIAKTTRKKPWKTVLSLMGSGGTTFGPAMVSELGSAASDGFNILIFSDRDILAGDNWKNFVRLFQAHKRQVFFIADKADTWKDMCHKLGQVSDNFTHL